MQKKPYEDILAVVCDYWWVLLILLIVGLILYFARAMWFPIFGLV